VGRPTIEEKIGGALERLAASSSMRTAAAQAYDYESDSG
jgi:hypothetical protein